VIRVLAEEKIPIAMIVGTSAGSLIGALYAAGSDPFDLEWTAFKLEKDDIFDYSILSSWRGTVAGERIEAFVNENIKAKSIEEAKIPFFAVAADLLTGERIVLDTGPFGRAVRASSAIPGVFQPVALGDRMLVDGGVVDTIPSDVARERGADLVIAVDIGRELPHEPPSSSIGIVLQSIFIMAREISRTGLASADVAIAPKVDAVASFDFSKKRECVAAGIAPAREALPRIRGLIDAWKRSHATS
jgi:NTE family protein